MVKLIVKGYIIYWFYCLGILCMDLYSLFYYIMIYYVMKDIEINIFVRC